MELTASATYLCLGVSVAAAYAFGRERTNVSEEASMPADQRAAGRLLGGLSLVASRGGRRRRGGTVAAAARGPCHGSRTGPDAARPLLPSRSSSSPCSSRPSRSPWGLPWSTWSGTRSRRRSSCSSVWFIVGPGVLGDQRARAAVARPGAGPADLGGGRTGVRRSADPARHLAAGGSGAVPGLLGADRRRARAGRVARPLPRGPHPAGRGRRPARSVPPPRSPSSARSSPSSRSLLQASVTP